MYPVKKWNEVVSINSGKNQKEVENPNGKYPIYGSGGIIGYADNYLCEANTVIVGRKGTIDNPLFVQEPFWNIDTAFGVVAGNEIIPKYLFYFCRLFNFRSLDKSTGRPSVSKSDLLKIEMPVPKKEIQECIVSKIEELFSQLDNGVETLKKLKEQLQVYRQVALNTAFKGDYEKKPLSEISTVISGYAFKSKKYTSDGKYLVVKIGNVKAFKFDFSKDCSMTNETDERILEKYLLKRGDCLITLTGTRGKRDYGYVAMITNQENYLLNQRVAALRFDQSVTLPEFFQYYLSSFDYRNQFFSYETGNVGQGNVGVKALSEPIVVAPELECQKRIVEEIESKLSACDSLERIVNETLQQAEAMRQSILKKAFEGELI